VKIAQTWDLLESVVDRVSYKDGSRFALARDDESNYAVLFIFLGVPNSYREDRAERYTRFEFVVPVATYDSLNWARWVFERVKEIELHEVREWFKLDGERPYQPHHGDGEDPYLEWHLSTAARAAKAPGDAREPE
jgi:hypothetical protein